MDQQKSSDAAATPSNSQAKPIGAETVQPIPAPATDPTNPYNQEPTGEWVANERAADRRNNEPGMTEGERKRHKY